MTIRRRRKHHPCRSGPRRKRRGPVPARWSGVEVRVNGRRLEGVADVGWESGASNPVADIERAVLGAFRPRNTYSRCDVHERTRAALAVALQGEVNEAMQREINAWCEAHGMSPPKLVLVEQDCTVRQVAVDELMERLVLGKVSP